MTSTLQITLLGKLTIRCGAAHIDLPAKSAELLCYLLLRRGRPQTREALATTLWGEADGAQAKKYLRQSLWQLHQALDASAAPPLLVLDHDWVALNPHAALNVDAHRLEEAWAALGTVPGAQFDDAQDAMARAAADLYQGALLDGWYQEWCLIERERYQALYGALLDRLVDHCLAAGELDTGVGFALRLLSLEPTRERTHRRLMRLYAAGGDHGAALRQFALCAAVLEREFAVEPAALTQALVASIRAGEAGAYPEPAAPGLADELTQLRAAIARLHSEVELLKRALGAGETASG